MQLYVCGTAGTGKSFLIKTLADHLTLAYPSNQSQQPSVLLGAPTGIAAIQIQGATNHSLFGIDPQQGRDVFMQPLNSDRLNQKRNLFAHVRLIIIDEISMCSNIMLAKIHKRLCEIRDNTREAFAGFNMVVFGDLLQLPPVNAPFCFQVHI